MTSASGAYCIVEPSFREGGWGEVFAVAGARDASVVWAEGFHSGWNARMLAGRGSARHFRHREGSVPPLGEKSLPLSGGERKENCVAIQAPSFGRERPLVARALSTSRVLPRAFLVVPKGTTFYCFTSRGDTCVVWCVHVGLGCPEDRRVAVAVGGCGSLPAPPAFGSGARSWLWGFWLWLPVVDSWRGPPWSLGMTRTEGVEG